MFLRSELLPLDDESFTYHFDLRERWCVCDNDDSNGVFIVNLSCSRYLHENIYRSTIKSVEEFLNNTLLRILIIWLC